MKQQTAVVLGATGLIGRHVVELLLADDTFNKVRLLVRKPFPMHHPKLEVQQVDFNNTNEFKTGLGAGDCLFCCVGTTNSKVKGDKTAYRKVDYDIPVNAAKYASEAGFSKYLLVSAIGSNTSSQNFYVKLKGEVEQAVEKYTFRSIHIFQPSILLGKRNEVRLGESIGKGVMKALSFLFVGSLKKYKGIEAMDVAKAMVEAAKKGDCGLKKYTYKEMMKLIQ